MKRLLLVLLVIAVLVPTGAAAATSTYRQVNQVAQGEWRWEECRFALHDGKAGYTPTEVRITLRCARRLWPGNLDLGYRIVGCESGFDPTAQNPESSAGGVWQVLDSTWVGWKQTWAPLMDRLRLVGDKLNGRANAILGWRVFRNTTTPWNASAWCWRYI